MLLTVASQNGIYDEVKVNLSSETHCAVHLEDTLGAWSLVILLVLHAPAMWNRLSSRGDQKSPPDRTCMLGSPCEGIVCRNAYWGNGMEANALISLGMSPQRRVANPIILHHSSPIHLAFSFFFSTGNLWLPCWISSKPACYGYKFLPGQLGSQRADHYIQSVALSMSTLTAPSPMHHARNAFMTDTF